MLGMQSSLRTRTTLFLCLAVQMLFELGVMAFAAMAAFMAAVSSVLPFVIAALVISTPITVLTVLLLANFGKPNHPIGGNDVYWKIVLMGTATLAFAFVMLLFLVGYLSF